jgi:tetratricopeptide (TPR) repeat protein
VLSKLGAAAGTLLSLLALPCSVVAAESATPEPALATEQPDDAKLVYERAALAYEERKYSDAIRLFQRADALRPNPAFDFNVGLAYEDMGDPARALASYRSYVRRLPEAPDRADVDVRIERLERTLERAEVQQVTVLSEPSGARLEIDGKPVGITPWTGEIGPGFHQLVLQAQGFAREERTFDLPPARAIDVPVTLVPEAPEPPPPPNAPESPAKLPCEGTCLGEVRGSSWLIAGAGFVSLGTAIGFELHRSDRESAARAESNQVAASRLFDDAFRAQKWATAFAVTGGALIVTGGVLAVLDIHDAKHPGATAAGIPTGDVAWQFGCDGASCAVGATTSF